jgi:hypothetical protein
MSSSIPFGHVISDSGNITVFVNGKPYSFERNNPNYERVKEAVARKDGAEIERLGTIPQTLENYAGGNVKVEHGVLTYKTRQIDTSLTRRILKLMQEGFPFDSMVKFLDNLMQNPSRHAVKELYNFLVNRNLPITENGCFLAYKAVRPDYMDWHTGTVRNQIGDSPDMERNEVDEEWRNECSSGFHVGAIEYVSDFHRGQGHIMIVEVNPKDVVSVPVNEFTKCRTCKYTVVGEMDGELVAQLYKTTSNSFEPCPSPATNGCHSSPSMAAVHSEDDDYPDYEDDDDDDDNDEE